MLRYFNCASLLLTLFAAVSAQAGVTYTVDASTSDGSPLTNVTPGVQIILDITVRTDDFASSVAASVNNYDNTVVSLDAAGSTIASTIFNQFCFPAAGCFNGLTNQVGVNVTFQESAVGPGVESEFLAALGLSPAAGNGSIDEGLGGVAGAPQFRVVFTATGLGTTTFQIGTYAEYLDGYTGTVDLVANNATVTVTIGAGLDADGDGLTDSDEENIYFTDPLVADTDGDGLLDGEEVNTYSTNPLVADSDGDGLIDGDEVSRYFTNPLLADAGVDSDGDGLSNVSEADTYYTDPQVADAGADTDGDGLSNVAEVDVYFTDPQIADAGADTDGDGLTNVAEVDTYSTDPTLADTDGDGTSDGDEVNVTLTDPLTPSPPTEALNTNAAVDAGSDVFAAIETDGFGNWVTVWQSDDDLSGTVETDFDILTARSSDNGASWTAPVALNTNASSDSALDSWSPVLRTDRAGVWISAWPSDSDLAGTVGTDRDILFARSTDNGATWSAPSPIDTNASTDSGADDRVALGYGDGVFVALWQSDDGASGPDLEIKFSRSTDGGLSWSPGALLSSNGSNDSWPTVASDGMGNWVAVWESDESLIGGDGDLLKSRSTDGGATWSAPMVLNSNAIFDLGSDERPRLVTDGFGTWLVVWDSDENLGGAIGTDRDIFFSRSTDIGVTWTPPTALDSRAATDTGDEINPDPATDFSGGWTVVWESDEDLGGALGTDFDLFVSRSLDNATTWSTGGSLRPEGVSDVGGDFFPRIASQPGGSSVVVWHSDDSANGVGTDWDVFFVSGLYTVDSDGDDLSDADETNRYGTNPNVSDADADTDGDGLSNVDEVDIYLTDFLVADSDGDGLVDGDEVNLHSTDPLIEDSDGDGLTDGQEVNTYATDPTVSDIGADTDGDGLLNVSEVEVYFTNPAVSDLNADTDGDGLTNVDEVDRYITDPQVSDAGADTDGDGLTNVSEVDVYFTNPIVSDADADTDGDGLTNVDEVDRYITDPQVSDADADTDGDGLMNVSEVDVYFTDPTVSDADADTDGDGLTNVDEVDRYITDPQVADAGADTDGDGISNVAEVDLYLTNPQVSDVGADTDGDGLTNISEVDSYFTDPSVADADLDSDGDGLTNVSEVDVFFTDPLVADSDGDGLSDGDEVNTHSTDPLVVDTDGDSISDGDEVNVTFTDPLTPDPPAYVLNKNADTDSGSDIFTAIETDGFGNWVAVWQSDDDLSGTVETDFDILTARSSNNGASWTDPIALNTNASSDSALDSWPPVLRTDRAGVWIAAWPSEADLTGTVGTDRDILFARSTDNGATWSAPSPIDTNASIDSGTDDRVTLGYGDGVFVALWQSDDGASGPDLEIKFSRSTDGGLTWSPGVLLSSNGANDSWPTVASDGMGRWVAVWRSDDSLLGGDGDLLTSRSGDGGLTWTAPAILNSNALSDFGADERPRLGTDGFGTWLVVWDSDEDLGGTIGTDRDVLFARSLDEGTTWTAPAALDAAAATDSGDDINPDPTTDVPGSWTVVWESDDDVGGTVGTDFDVFVSQSSDDGSTWSTGIALHPDAATDVGGDFFPRIATQPAGPALITWHSDENARSAVATDWDLFFVDGLTSSVMADCDANGPLAATTGSLGYGESHFCEDWVLVSQPAADLRDSFLARIDLSSAILNGSLLLKSDLSGADLSNASLFNANLGEAILAGANLTSADLSFANLSGAYYDQHTLFPSGGNHASGAWGLPGGVTPWEAGMVPVPEPAVGWTLIAGVACLTGLARARRRL